VGKCPYCGEQYDLGPKLLTLGINGEHGYYPEGQNRYFTHCRESAVHQQIMRQQFHSTKALLERLPEILHQRKKERDRARRKAKKEAALAAD